MILKMFTIYDRKSALHHPPCYCHSVGHALRVFTDAFAVPDSVFHKHPGDFQVFEVGSFDDRTAKLEAVPPHLVASGTELVPSKLMTPAGNGDDVSC